ncbi:MAG: hypothetical protein KJ906_01450 [Nanoarchaeota archaeon]|nr:hypothetical protein [Nanoarchaeota archaeon]
MKNKDSGIRSKLSYDIIESMPNGPIKKYFNKHWSKTHTLANLINNYEKNGYNFDKEAGMLFRPRKIAQEELNRTCLDIVFLRPSTAHYHPDVIEMVTPLSGQGKLYTFSENPTDSDDYYISDVNLLISDKPRSRAIDINQIHAFKPDPYLEINLVCSGILDMDKEVTIKSFDKWSKYV